MQQTKFRLTPKAIAWECSIILFVIPVFGTVFLIWYLISGLNEGGDIGIFRFALPLFGFFAIVLTLVSVALIFIAIGRAIFSYLTLSEKGLEYRLWPLHKIRCTWADVEQIKKSALPFQGELLILKKGNLSGFHPLMDFNKGNYGVIKTLPVIPLYQISGWQDGRLKNELKKYAPNLFVEQSTT